MPPLVALPSALPQPDRLANVVVLANGKGGVGKTSLAAALAVAAAQSGRRVLAVDVDPQANLTQNDLGIAPADSDDGRSLLGAALDLLDEPAPLPSGRPGLDVICGGDSTARLAQQMAADLGGDPRAPGRLLARGLGGVATRYDLVVIDTPPATTGALSDAALTIGTWLVIPTKADDASLDGVVRVLQRAAAVAGRGGIITLLGVALFGLGAQSTRIRRQVREELDAALKGRVPVLEAVVRHAEKAAVDARANHLVAAEYALVAQAAERDWQRRLREGFGGPTFSSAAAGLAGDYERLVGEVLSLIDAARRATPQGPPRTRRASRREGARVVNRG